MAPTPPRIVDLDDIIQTSTDVPHPDDYHEPPIDYPELTHEELDELHQRYEHPMTLDQINMMRQIMIDSEDEEEVFPETIKYDDDEDDADPWNNIANDVTEKHLIRMDTVKHLCRLCEKVDHTLVECKHYRPDHQGCQYCDAWDHETLDCRHAHFAVNNYMMNTNATIYQAPSTWDDWYRENIVYNNERHLRHDSQHGQ